jgi:uncharacterized protein with FMN-binding domain
VRRSPIVLVGTAAGLVGLLTFHTKSAQLSLGSLSQGGLVVTTTTSIAGGPPRDHSVAPTTAAPTTVAPTTAAPTTAAPTTAAPTTAAPTTAAPTTAAPTTAAPTTAAPTTAAPTTAAVVTARTATGGSVNYSYGVLSVAATVSGTKLVSVSIASIDDGGSFHSESIDQQAIPILEQEALQAQSASIQGVSGASYTSAGFEQSLQSALTELGFH